MTVQWGVMFYDGSVRTGYNGPRARSYCEAEAIRIEQTHVVCRSDILKGGWQEVDSRNRFDTRVFGDEVPRLTGRLQVICSLCEYRSAPDLRVFAPVRAFEDHWYDKHIKEVPPQTRKSWWRRWFS